MKKIKTFGIFALRNEESFGFLKVVVTETDNLPAEETTPAALTNAVTTFKEAYKQFDYALESSAANPDVATASAADTARDQAWRGANNYLAAMCAHPDEETRNTALMLKADFDKYGDPTSLSQTEESGVLHNLLTDLKSWAEHIRTAVTFDPWLNDLNAKEEAFLEAVAARNRSEASRAARIGLVKERRTAAEAAYRTLVDTVNALSILNGEADYEDFIDHVNAMIDRQKTVLKTRATNNAKKEEDAPASE